MFETAKLSEAETTRQGAGGVSIPNQAAASSRLDALTGEWTVFAPQRDARPDEFRVSHVAADGQRACPFCRGQEQETPPPLWVGRVDGDTAVRLPPTDDADGHWSVRVVPNKYPAVDSRVAPTASPFQRDHDLFESRPLLGGHEVIIESPSHRESITDLDLPEANLVFMAYRDRIRHWRSVPGIRYLSVFKNVGGDAGASIRHSHSQLIALDRLPKHVQSTTERMRRHRAKTGCCLQCDLVRAEIKARQRIVTQTESLVAYCPFASRLPMMIRVTSKEHRPCFGDCSEQLVEELSRMVVRLVSWLENLLPNVAYNYLLHTVPPGFPEENGDAFHWSLELFPRLTRVAGFEWSSQCMINPVLPEDAAAKYRRCATAEDPRIVLER